MLSLRRQKKPAETSGEVNLLAETQERIAATQRKIAALTLARQGGERKLAIAQADFDYVQGMALVGRFTDEQVEAARLALDQAQKSISAATAAISEEQTLERQLGSAIKTIEHEQDLRDAAALQREFDEAARATIAAFEAAAVEHRRAFSIFQRAWARFPETITFDGKTVPAVAGLPVGWQLPEFLESLATTGNFSRVDYLKSNLCRYKPELLDPNDPVRVQMEAQAEFDRADMAERERERQLRQAQAKSPDGLQELSISEELVFEHPEED